jgi:hypothetical protein
MNEENKYYVPEISEFHVGFECELKDNDKVHEWFPIMCTMSTPFDVDSSHYSARVKYLDKEDIESLGFKQSERDEFWYDHIEDRFWLYKEDNLSDRWIIDDNESEYHFAGTIKNKSELKKLMQQLNIK